MLIKQSSKYPLFFTLPIFAYLVYVFYSHLNSNSYSSMIGIVNFYIHEIGHLVFMVFFNQFILTLGGTLFQLIIPIACLIGFYRQEDYFAVSICFAWIGTNFFSISTYSGDAIRQVLPLYSFAGPGNGLHDWTYIFNRLGVIEHTELISNCFKYIAIGFFLLFIIYSLILIVNRFRE